MNSTDESFSHALTILSQNKLTNSLNSHYFTLIDKKYTLPIPSKLSKRFQKVNLPQRNEYPLQLFLNNFQKLKTVFGHKLIDESLIEEYSEYCNCLYSFLMFFIDTS